MKRARVLLADDHPLTLAGIRSVLDTRYEVVAECGDGRSAVEDALRLRPDIVVLDVGLPLLNGIEAARQIRKGWPEARILFLSMHSGAMYLREAFSAGAAGYVLKSAAAEELQAALRSILSGKPYVSPAFGQCILEDLLALAGAARQSNNRLTDRQREVLQLVAEGRSSKEIAFILNVSLKTVEFHRGRLMRKLGITSVAELTTFALRSGLTGDSPG